MARARLGVSGILLAALLAPSTASAQPVAEEESKVERHLGLMYGFGPGIFTIDLEWGRFYGFVSTPVPLDIFVRDDSSLGFLACAVGAGPSFALDDDEHWRLDLFASVSPMRYGNFESYIGFGVGAGFHYTTNAGYTFGMKLPVIGYAVATGNHPIYDASAAGSIYYIASFATLPVATFGYRF